MNFNFSQSMVLTLILNAITGLINSQQLPINLLTNINGGLLLTPYITSNNIETARNLSVVPPFAQFPYVISHAGYITVDQATGSNLFFWFIEAIEDSSTAPVILYMSGGPGVTSLWAAFAETGPFYVSPDQTLVKRDCTWINKFNVIYVDAPVGGGYSYSNLLAYSTNDSQVGQHVHKFILQFFTLFKEYLPNDFYVAGESYGGRFVVNTALAIINNKANDQIKINFKGIVTLSGFLDPEIMVQSADVLRCNGLINDLEYIYWQSQTKIGLNLIPINQTAAAIILLPMMLFTTPISPFTLFTGFQSYYNSEKSVDPSQLSDFVQFIQTNDFRQRIHVGSNVLHNGLTSLPVQVALLSDMLSSNVQNVATILKSNYKVLLMSGQLDLLANPNAQRQFARRIQWPGSVLYNNSLRMYWKAPNETEVSGYVTQVLNLLEIMIRRAGHNIANDQACNVFDALDRFIYDKPFIGVTPAIPPIATDPNTNPFNLFNIGVIPTIPPIFNLGNLGLP